VFDVVLRAGSVVDGDGSPPRRADVGVIGDRIAAVSTPDALETADAREVVDCPDRFVFPGFIDAHVHGDALVFDPDAQMAALAQGVTTFVVGQDGLSFAPSSPATADYVSDYFAAVNGRWTRDAVPGTVAELLAAYDGATPLNVATLAPHGNLRFEALGAADVAADHDALAAMRSMLEKALDDGAVGLSTGLDYVPGRFADAAELASLCEVVAAVGGVYVSHMRGYESAAPQGMAEVRQIAERSGVAAHVSHYHGPAPLLGGLIDEMLADGIDVTFDSYPYVFGASILAMTALPAAVQSGGPDATLNRLADKEIRVSLDQEWFPAKADDLARARLSHVGAQEFGWAEGLPLTAAAERAGLAVGEFVCELLLAARLDVGVVFRHPPTNSDDEVRALLRHRAQFVGSDGIFLGGAPHPRAWGAFARCLGTHTRDQGDWTWGEAAAHLAGRAARRFGLADRGFVREGFAADLVVLDPTAVTDNATYDDPRRPASGVDRVYVNGGLAFAEGALAARDCGRALRRQR
jgi:N-acyl-D-amino-acid deacylase